MGPESAASPGQLAQAIENYFADHPAADLLEDCRVVFDLRSARNSVGQSHGRCLLQFWSDERNLMSTVVDVQQRAEPAHYDAPYGRDSPAGPPKVEWGMFAVGEHWRRELTVVFRKSSSDERRS